MIQIVYIYTIPPKIKNLSKFYCFSNFRRSDQFYQIGFRLCCVLGKLCNSKAWQTIGKAFCVDLTKVVKASSLAKNESAAVCGANTPSTLQWIIIFVQQHEHTPNAQTLVLTHRYDLWGIQFTVVGVVEVVGRKYHLEYKQNKVKCLIQFQ